jgi:hypothetical protein
MTWATQNHHHRVCPWLSSSPESNGAVTEAQWQEPQGDRYFRVFQKFWFPNLFLCFIYLGCTGMESSHHPQCLVVFISAWLYLWNPSSIGHLTPLPPSGPGLYHLSAAIASFLLLLLDYNPFPTQQLAWCFKKVNSELLSCFQTTNAHPSVLGIESALSWPRRPCNLAFAYIFQLIPCLSYSQGAPVSGLHKVVSLSFLIL